MVTVLLSGGLGNQMFQYAAAKALAERLGTALSADLYALKKKSKATTRHFELDVFALDIPIVSTAKGKFFVKAHPAVQKFRGIFRLFGFFSDTMAILYQPTIEILRDNTYLSGYFQNERYFKGYEPVIRRDFSFTTELSDRNKGIGEQMRTEQSVSVHIRRGDYINDQRASSNFVTCDKVYYDKAIAMMRKKVQNPVFYIFSEDLEWVKDNLSFGENIVHYIDWNRGDDSYIDMQLMSLCQHNIIANSSFSWWGAWLNSNPDKVVLAPSQWFRDEVKNNLLDDFYPEGWIKID